MARFARRCWIWRLAGRAQVIVVSREAPRLHDEREATRRLGVGMAALWGMWQSDLPQRLYRIALTCFSPLLLRYPV